MTGSLIIVFAVFILSVQLELLSSSSVNGAQSGTGGGRQGFAALFSGTSINLFNSEASDGHPSRAGNIQPSSYTASMNSPADSMPSYLGNAGNSMYGSSGYNVNRMGSGSARGPDKEIISEYRAAPAGRMTEGTRQGTNTLAYGGNSGWVVSTTGSTGSAKVGAISDSVNQDKDDGSNSSLGDSAITSTALSYVRDMSDSQTMSGSGDNKGQESGQSSGSLQSSASGYAGGYSGGGGLGRRLTDSTGQIKAGLADLLSGLASLGGLFSSSSQTTYHVLIFVIPLLAIANAPI